MFKPSFFQPITTNKWTEIFTKLNSSNFQTESLWKRQEFYVKRFPFSNSFLRVESLHPPVHSISLVKGTQASIPSCYLFVFLKIFTKKVLKSISSPIPLDVHSISIPNPRRRKGNLSVDRGEQHESILIPFVQPKIPSWKWKQKEVEFRPNQAKNCLIV